MLLQELKIKGLYTSPNQYSEAPEGSLRLALNGVIDNPSIFERRRGRNFYSTTSFGANITKLFEYNSRLLAHTGSTLYYDDGAGVFTAYSEALNNPSASVNSHRLEENLNCYFTSSEGIKKLDNIAGPIMQAGAPRGLDLDGSLSGASGFLANDTSVAYRVVFGYKDENNNLILGAPSQRFVISNSTGGTRDVSLTFTLPQELTTNWFYQIYRTTQFSPASTEPNDETYLALEDNPTAGEITARLVTVIDSTPDSLLGATLYTSPSQEGIENANEPPPYAKDMTLFNNMVLYANTKTKQRLFITLIGVGSPLLQLNDTVTIDGVVFTAKATETASSGEFQLFTGGTAAENIDNTARSLVRVINRYASNTTFYAYYISGFNDLPGKILLEDRAFSDTTFAATSIRGASFSPTLPIAGTSISSTNDVQISQIMASKLQQPEAVPLGNAYFAGSGNKEILRIIALRDSAFVLKQDGVYRVTGTTPDTLQITEFDRTVTLLAIESAVVMNNAIYCAVEQGIAVISDEGVNVISKGIRDTYLQKTYVDNFHTISFGLSYEEDSRYVLFTSQASTDTYAKYQFVWNDATKTWTTWDLRASSAYVLDGFMYTFNPQNMYIYKERKNFNAFDYADESYDKTIVSVDAVNNAITLDSATNVFVDDAIRQGDVFGIVTAINGAIITLDDSYEWETGTCTSNRAFTSRVGFLPTDCNTPTVLKRFQEATLVFQNASFRVLNGLFISNITPSFNENNYIELNFSTSLSGAFGSLEFGEGGFGGDDGIGGQVPLRTYIPRDVAMGFWIYGVFELQTAFSSLGFCGMSYLYRPLSTSQK